MIAIKSAAIIKTTVKYRGIFSNSSVKKDSTPLNNILEEV